MLEIDENRETLFGRSQYDLSVSMSHQLDSFYDPSMLGYQSEWTTKRSADYKLGLV